MSTPVTRTGVADMAMAVVFDLQVRGGQGLLQRVTHAGDPVTHGSTLRNGRTSVRTYTPAAT